MKKATIVILGLTLLVLSAAVAPVMAIGPSGAVNNENPNFSIDVIDAVHNWRGGAVGQILWTPMPVGQPHTFWSEMRLLDATSGGGKTKNAIAATRSTFAQWMADITAYGSGEPTVNENKWIFLSPDGSGNQDTFGPNGAYGTHGMVWYWLFISFYTGGYEDPAALASAVAVQFPKGLFWQYNFIG